jgi:hypothetical protein
VTEDHSESDPVSHEEVEKQVGAAVRKLFARVGVSPSATELRDFFDGNGSLPPTEQMPKAVVIAMRFAFGTIARKHTKDVKTRGDLAKVLRTIDEASQGGPSMMRAVFKRIQENLPRGAGPGRRRKFTDGDCGRLCDEITLEMRNGLNYTNAIEKVAANSRKSIGKTISERKLKDVWKDREKFPSKTT